MPTFIPVDHDPFADQAQAGGVQTIPGQGGAPTRVVMDMSRPSSPQLIPVDHDPFAGPSLTERAAGLGKAFDAGVARGIAGLGGMVGDFTDLGARGIGAATNFVERQLGLPETPAPDRSNSILSKIPTSASLQEAIQREFYNGAKPYEPQNRAEKFARTIGEFTPGGAVGRGLNLARRGAQVIFPAIASEAAGEATEGSAAEPWARLGGALAGGGIASFMSRPGTAQVALRQQLPEGVTAQMVDQAEALMTQARQQGIELAWPEALSQVAQRPVLTNTMRSLEAAPQTEAQMAEFFARRPQQVEQAARSQFDSIAPVEYSPSSIGPSVSDTARQVIQDSPEAAILSDVLWRAGPRMTSEQAGNVIQGELGRTYQGREGMRAALAERDYGAARNAPATIPLNGGHRVADVTKHYLDRPDIPILLDPAERAAAKAQWFKDNNPTTKMPIVGERATEFGQVDASAVLRQLDGALDTAKGAVRQGLQAARSALFKPDGTLDMSIAGLHNSRQAIDDLISQAQRAGANQTVLRLQEAKRSLDQALEQVPAYGQARTNFQAASRPLEPFDQSRVPGRIIERDEFNSRYVMPPERVPGTIQSNGPSGARDFNAVATPAAREAFEQNIVTQVLDRATKEGADLSADSIRQALRQNEDLLRQYPGVRDRLESIAIARDGLAKVERLPIGKLAQRDLTTKKAVDALFPQNPLPNSQHEIAQAVSDLAARKPNVAEQLVRTHIESVFNNASRDLQTGANQAGGAKFRAQLIANPQQEANLRAAVEALPNGQARWQGFNRFLDILEATGTRQGIGSRTTYNEQFFKEAAKGGIVGDVVKTGANPLSMGQRFVDRYQQWRLGRNLGQLADILTDPASGRMLRAIANTPNDRAAAAVAVRLITYENASRRSEPVNKSGK